jgi:NitT/TauT family transport system ATP-binding protein
MTDSASSVVLLDGVGKTFGDIHDSAAALAQVSLTLQPGEFVAITGRSGIGKSTLLRLIAGLDQATVGRILLFGHHDARHRKGVGYVIQDYSRSLLPWFTVEKNVALALRASKIPKRDRRHRVHEMLERVGLGGKEGLHPWQLSGGMQQRVAIARALVSSPRLLLLDEPFASVDAQTRLDLEDLVLNVVHADSVATILVTHDIEEALFMADRVLLMAGSPASITTQYDVDLVRPRHQVATRAERRFLELRKQIYAELGRTEGTGP